MLLSGNIQVDRDHLERPGNVVIERSPDAAMLAALASWARAATRHGNHFWAQLSHAGRQTMKNVNPHPKAPSAVKVGLPGGQFGEPVALTTEEIRELVRRFGVAAAACKTAGFTGVQVHAAHGYLMSSFLSPRTNLREDAYGGSLENRARALLEAVGACREAVGPDFPVAVKLNSADFQKGGFAFEDSLQVARWQVDGDGTTEVNSADRRAAWSDVVRGGGGPACGPLHPGQGGLLRGLRRRHAPGGEYTADGDRGISSP